MVSQMMNLERAARIAMGDSQEPLTPPSVPQVGPFAYFRIAILVFAAFIFGLVALNYFSIIG